MSHWRALRTLLGMTVSLASCSGSGVASIDGVWILESFSEDGEQIDVEIGVNAAEQPWVEINEFLSGSFGCNGFGTPHEDTHTFSSGLLQPGEVFSSMAGCFADGEGVDLMAAEEAFRGVIRDHPEGIGVEVSGGRMIWTAGAA